MTARVGIRPAPILGEVWLKDWQSAGLIKASAIKPVFATLEQGLIIRSLGALALADREAPRQAVAQILG